MAQSEAKEIGDVILAEVLPEVAFCRETETITYANTAVVGSVLQTSSGEYILCVTGAKAAAICLGVPDTTSTDDTSLVLERGPAVVKYDGLGFNALDTAGKTAAVAALKALQIDVRTGPTRVTL